MNFLPCLLCVAILWPVVGAGADPLLPDLFDVSGVAGDDVLNVRERPDAASAILTTLPPDRTGVEVLRMSQDGKWARIGLGEASGWVAARFLAPRPPRPDDRLPVPLRCHGTEPFWGLNFPAPGMAEFERMPDPDTPMTVTAEIPVAGRIADFAVTLEGSGTGGTAFVAREDCSDGMSDRDFGLSIRLLMQGSDGAKAYSGCCSLYGG